MEKRNQSTISLFDVLNATLFIVIGFLAVFPYLHILAKSFSGEHAVTAGIVTLYPVNFHLDVYKYVLLASGFMNAFKISVFVTVFGTVTGLLITVMAAYPLSKPDFRGRKIFLLLVVFSMLFYGGIVPSYFLMKGLHLINTVWAMVIPTVFVPFNMLIVKTFFEGVPESIAESARIDGAGNFRTLFSIVLPVSLPVLATIGLFYAVSYWNNYFHPLIFINKRELKPLQVYLYEIINSSADASEMISMSKMENLSIGGIQAAVIMTSTVPMLLLYPFLQKYFVYGLTIGSVKG